MDRASVRPWPTSTRVQPGLVPRCSADPGQSPIRTRFFPRRVLSHLDTITSEPSKRHKAPSSRSALHTGVGVGFRVPSSETKARRPPLRSNFARMSIQNKGKAISDPRPRPSTLSPLELPPQQAVDWIRTRCVGIPQYLPVKLLGWLRMTELRRSLGEDETAPQLQLFSDASQSALVALEPGHGTSGFAAVSKVVVWVPNDLHLNTELLLRDVLHNFVSSRPLLFSPIESRNLTLAERGGASLRRLGEAYRVWRYDPSSSIATPNLFECTEAYEIDTATGKDIDSILSLSTVEYGREYLERLTSIRPLRELTCVLRDKRTGAAVSWAVSHTDFSIGLVGTAEGHRRQGLACVVIDEVRKKQEQHGHSNHFCFIADGNDASQRLFRRAGFVCDTEEEYVWALAESPRELL